MTLSYKGEWNITTNSPYLINGIGTSGDLYRVTYNPVSPVIFTCHFNFGSGDVYCIVGQYIFYTGTEWHCLPDSGSLTSAILSLNGLVDSVQTFVNDSNVAVLSSGTTHHITWSGTLPDSRISSSALWNAKQNALSGIGFVKTSGSSITYDPSSYYLNSNPAGYITSGFVSATPPISYTSGTISMIEASAANSGYLTSGTWNTFNSKQAAISITTSGNSGAATFSSPILNIPNYTLSGLNGYSNTNPNNYITLSSLSLTTGTTSSYNNLTGLITVPAIAVNPSIHTVTRPINSTTFTPSASVQATLIYTIQISCTATIGSNASGSLTLQYSTNAGSSWTTIGTVSNSNTVTLAIALNLVNVQTGTIIAMVPANALCRMVQSTTGTSVITYISGQEIY